VQVRFRTRSSFLVAYSVNLSKGGIFLETDSPAPIGTAVTLKMHVADAGVYEILGHVTWIRAQADAAAGPAGMGVEFDDVDEAVGGLIDELVTDFRGLNVLVFSQDGKDRSSVARTVRSIIGTADVVEAAGTSTAEALLGDEIDLVIVDGEAPDGAGWLVLRAAKNRDKKIPVIALCTEESERQRAIDLGADEVSDNPPVFADFQDLLLRALGRPSTVG